MTAPVNYTPLYEPPEPVEDWNPLAQIVQIFAEDNGWPYYPLAVRQPLPGVVFRERDGNPRFMQRSVNIVRIPGPPLTEIGNSFYAEIAVGNQFTRSWGYVALELETPAPPLVLVNQRLAPRSPLPSLPDVTPMPFKNQDRFLLYADPDAFAWADWLFDDEMQTLLDDGSLGFHVEIAGGSLFLYAPHPLAVPDPAVWQRLLTLIGALRARLGGRLPEPRAPIASHRPALPSRTSRPTRAHRSRPRRTATRRSLSRRRSPCARTRSPSLFGAPGWCGPWYWPAGSWREALRSSSRHCADQPRPAPASAVARIGASCRIRRSSAPSPLSMRM